LKGFEMEFEVFGYKINIEKKALKNKESGEMPSDLKWALEILEKYGKKIPPSPKKVESAKRASKIKANRAKEKVINAVNLLKLQGEHITAYKVAKTAGISYNTAKKYLKNLQNNQNNKD
jgi:Fic family protein